MADDFVLRNGNDFVLRNGGDKIIRNPDVVVVVPEGGGSGRGKVTSVGVSLVDKQLGPNRPKIISSGKSEAKIQIPFKSHSLGKLFIPVVGKSESVLTRNIMATSIAPILRKTYVESKALIKRTIVSRSTSYPDLTPQIPQMIKAQKKLETKMERLQKILTIQSLIPLLEEETKQHLEFSFAENIHNEQLIAFTHSSSWIGNVRYDTEAKTMRILMNGKAFTHCGVERIDYDKFEGAPSKGEHWWREIKDQFNC